MSEILKVGFISLGCDKNRVDTEYMMAALPNGFILTDDKEQADIIVVNTCGFIAPAKKESIDAILEAAVLKNKKLKKLVVTGCMADRYGRELFEKIPEIDVVIGAGAYGSFGETLSAEGRVLDLKKGVLDFKKRVVTTPKHYAYLKVAEGCDNFCSYCAIPAIKGAYRSRSLESIDEELKLLKDGNDVKELILVAQDVTRYGIDLYREYSLLKLLDLLEKRGFEWVRLLYCYPELVTDGLIKAIASRKNICKYIDVPLQHIDDTVLKSMKRRNDGAYAKALIDRIRDADEGIAIRSTFITGYPTETFKAFENLVDFIGEYKLENAGFLTFSKEEGTAAALLRDLPYQTKRKRLRILRELQSKIIEENNKKRIGQTDKVLYEGIDPETGSPYGRNQYNAPEIDCLVYIDGAKEELEVGCFYDVRITGTLGHFDLLGSVVKQTDIINGF